MAEWIQTLNDASVPFLVWLQGFQSGGLTSYFQTMSWMGVAYFYILFFPFLYWCVSKRWGISAALALLIGDYVGEFIKWTFQLPRPPSPPVNKLWTESSPGFVSTHASTSLAVWGTLAVLIRKWWFTIFAVVIVLSIGVSRLYLGVHFPADVVGGWVVGLFAMWVVLWVLPKIEPRVTSWSAGTQIVATLVLTVLLVAIFPGDWDGFRPAEAGARDAGTMLGLLLGLIWDQHKLNYRVEGPWTRRILRYIIGLVIIAIAFLSLDYLFEAIAPDNYLIEQSLRLIRYSMVGFSITGLAPWLFQRLRLA